MDGAMYASLEASPSVGRRKKLDSIRIRSGLIRTWDRLRVGDPDPGLFEGQLLRPGFALAVAPAAGRRDPDDSIWLAALAVQLAHEASLVHDDVVDNAQMRRTKETVLARDGVGAALILGDQLLARAYLAAAATESMEFVRRFTRAIDETISGERDQGAASGRLLSPDEARRIARRKSGELFGIALAASTLLRGKGDTDVLQDLGRDLGLLYQKVDDLLDFCPGASTGKVPLADSGRGLWTWPRKYLPPGASPASLFRSGVGGIPAARALEELNAEGLELLRRIQRRIPWATEVREGVKRWLETAVEAVRLEISAAPPGGDDLGPVQLDQASSSDRNGVGWEGSDRALDILARHGRTFHFASRMMPQAVREPTARIYAFCRLVDDAVDRARHPDEARRALHRIEVDARVGYAAGGDGLVGRTMAEMRTADVPFRLVEELLSGVRMDLRPREYQDLVELRVYTHRVAGVVGHWIAGVAGVRDPWALSLADELGHAMQLTNIARDVGADLALGRLYLPLDLLDRHGLSREQLLDMAHGDAPIRPGFAAALEEVMGWADAGYGAAFQALPQLPGEYRRAMAVAARVYQGIHGEIRGGGYDTLRKRARTGLPRKGLLAARALWELRGANRRALPPSA